jgi:hypothetical protein
MSVGRGAAKTLVFSACARGQRIAVIGRTMWLDALDGGPGLRPMILSIGEKTVVVMKIAGDIRVTAGGRLVVRSLGDTVTASIEPNVIDRLIDDKEV